MLKSFFNFFLSLKTAFWLLLLLLGLLLYGSFIMPLKEEFQALQTVPLIPWLKGSRLGITWWLWGSIGILSVLTANTLACSIESVIKKRTARQWLLIISPQVAHAGFLFILLAHLLSSYGSFKGTAIVYRDTVLRMPNGLDVVFDEIKTVAGPSGYISEWTADIRYFQGERQIRSDIIRPNQPSFQDGLGIYIKTVQAGPFPVALIEVSREPGAYWALIGGILFIVGMVTLLALKIKREEGY